MVPADDRILEYLKDAGIVNPAVISRNVDLHARYISKRCRTLTKYGLVTSSEEGYYQITELGDRYLSGDAGPDDLESDEN
jgi:predicted transcriptional regulator